LEGIETNISVLENIYRNQQGTATTLEEINTMFFRITTQYSYVSLTISGNYHTLKMSAFTSEFLALRKQAES
jgi:hypothetical protein